MKTTFEFKLELRVLSSDTKLEEVEWDVGAGVPIAIRDALLDSDEVAKYLLRMIELQERDQR